MHAKDGKNVCSDKNPEKENLCAKEILDMMQKREKTRMNKQSCTRVRMGFIPSTSQIATI